VDEASVVVTVQSTAAAAGLVYCIISVTSALMRTHPFQYYNGLSTTTTATTTTILNFTITTTSLESHLF